MEGCSPNVAWLSGQAKTQRHAREVRQGRTPHDLANTRAREWKDMR